MNKIKTHRDLDVYKISMDWVVELYKITAKFPATEKFGLSSQLRRAGVSICSNIAEGAARNHPREYLQFLYVALGSVSEIETQLEIARRLGYINSIDQEKKMLDRLRQMLICLIRSIKRKSDAIHVP
jgi:four helix bundle protein